MNLRFAKNSIRVRISHDEFAQLKLGKSISLEVSLPRSHALRVTLNAAGNGQWQFDSDPTGMWISVSRSEIESLAEQLPSKEGIEHSFDTNKGTLLVSLEVDVRKSG